MAEIGTENFWSDLPFPATDGNGGNTVADEIGQSTALAHEADRCQRSRQVTRWEYPAPATLLAPFEVIMATSMRLSCWAKSSGVSVV